jgi:hypothetical protein
MRLGSRTLTSRLGSFTWHISATVRPIRLLVR